jgi:hypothetical protein
VPLRILLLFGKIVTNIGKYTAYFLFSNINKIPSFSKTSYRYLNLML